MNGQWLQGLDWLLKGIEEYSDLNKHPSTEIWEAREKAEDR